ncbi:hypothetical protein UFOVP820_31 [uncultured Caudovirales phage]|uniref:Uncharacterized protein n=1 Tax=uncultured Caudovirales phage TaxID=2100421 RepID=A0A6J5P2H7_9CAUD|nr:hypothetical protein UFOVP820_31 [uncultured Caudovirales phage]
MLQELKLVRGAVSTKDLVPVLSHFAICDDKIHGFNGRVHLCAPVRGLSGMAFTVPAGLFLRAFDACAPATPGIFIKEQTVVMKSGTFKAVLPIGSIDEFPMPVDSGDEKIPLINAGLLKTVRSLRSFIGDDATRPWCASIKFDSGKAFATNNIVLAEMTMADIGSFALPVFAVDEIIRIDQEPISYSLNENAITFHYAGGLWLRATLFEDQWPDAGALVDSVHERASLQAIPGDLRAAVTRVAPFCPDAAFPLIRFHESRVETLDGLQSASVEMAGLSPCLFHASPLSAVLAVADQADWSLFPKVPWSGNDMVGVLIGMRA